MVNTTLLCSTLEHIKANLEDWDQKRFSSCFAGWTLRLTKPVVAVKSDGITSWLELDGKPLTSMDIDREAAAMLGLTREQRIALFCGGNSLADLERLVSALVEGRPLHWSEYHAHV